MESTKPERCSPACNGDAAVIKRADNLRPGDQARIRDSWHTITEIIEAHPAPPGGPTLEVKAGPTIVARLAPNDLVEVHET
jgi:hypothetical protein